MFRRNMLPQSSGSKNKKILLASIFMLISRLVRFSILKVDATCSSETSVYFQWTEQPYIPDERMFHKWSRYGAWMYWASSRVHIEIMHPRNIHTNIRMSRCTVVTCSGAVSIAQVSSHARYPPPRSLDTNRTTNVRKMITLCSCFLIFRGDIEITNMW
jgi:hypothetical protein